MIYMKIFEAWEAREVQDEYNSWMMGRYAEDSAFFPDREPDDDPVIKVTEVIKEWNKSNGHCVTVFFKIIEQ